MGILSDTHDRDVHTKVRTRNHILCTLRVASAPVRLQQHLRRQRDGEQNQENHESARREGEGGCKYSLCRNNGRNTERTSDNHTYICIQYMCYTERATDMNMTHKTDKYSRTDYTLQSLFAQCVIEQEVSLF